METLSWKVRIAVLWVCGPILELASLVLISDQDGFLDRYGNLVPLAIFLFLLPFTMVVLSLTLRGQVNRWLNIVLGMFFVLVVYLSVFLEAGLGVIMYEDRWPAIGLEQPLILGLRIAVTALIPWFAWRWHPQET